MNAVTRPPVIVNAVSTRRPSRRRVRVVSVLAFVIIAITILLALRPAAGAIAYNTAISADGRYVALPHPADADTRRQAAYLARKYHLPLIAEPGAKTVEIRRFR